MENKPLLNERQLEVLLRSGPELDRIEPMLSPQLREVLVDLQRNAADAYAAGTWQVAATGETITVPESSSRKANGSLVESAQNALGTAYLDIAGESKSILKALMDGMGLTPSAPKSPASAVGIGR